MSGGAPGWESTLPLRIVEQASYLGAKTFLEVWNPDHGVAVTCSFEDMRDCMIAGALWLRGGMSVAKGEYVALLAGNSIAYLAISFGAMSIGAVSINLNWRNPPEVTKRLVTNLKPTVLVASAQYKEQSFALHTEVGVRVALLDTICSMEPDTLPFSRPSKADADALIADIKNLDPSAPCAVFFTGGTTGTPKAVPQTHKTILWLSEEYYKQFPAQLSPDVLGAGTCTFTPYFHVMGFVSNLCFNLHVGIRAFLPYGDAKLSPQMMLAAVEQLRPSALQTVPWIVEGLVELMRDPVEGAAAVDALRRLKLITFGGAALAPHCGPAFAAQGVKLANSYGQTELCGPCMFGKIDSSNADALYVHPGVRYELVRGEDDPQDEGELVLCGNLSATPGYLVQDPGAKYRPLSGDPTKSTTERFCTNDRFKEVIIDGGKALLYMCRADDLLVHTSGEMSNPLPTEQMLIAQCPSIINAVTVVGTGCPRCLAFIELKEGLDAESEEVVNALKAGLKVANSKQPQYSAVLNRHAMLLKAGSLPLTVKGTVQRVKVERDWVEPIKKCLAGTTDHPTLAPKEEDGDEAAYDSTAFSAKGAATKDGKVVRNYEFLTGARFIAAFWVVTVHHAGMPFLTSHNTVTAVLDGAMARAGVAMCFFMVTAGFGTHLSNTKTDLLTQGCSAYLKFAVERNDRIVLTLWLNLTLLFFLHPWVNPSQYNFSLHSYCEYVFCMITFNAPPVFDPTSEMCKGDGWFIGALVPLTLMYPLFARLIKIVDGMMGSTGVAVLAMALWAGYFFPVLALTREADDSGNSYDQGSLLGQHGVQRFIIYHAVDFFFGCAVANIVLRHKPLDDARLGEATPLPICCSDRTTNALVYARGALADLSVFVLFFYVFSTFANPECLARAPKDGDIGHFATCTSMNTKLLIDSHAFVPVFAIFLYGASAKGGMGLSARILEFSGLVAFGFFSLDAYLLSEPLGTMFVGIGFEMAGMKFAWTDGFVTYMMVLWLLAGLNATCLMAPLTNWLRSVIENKCSGSACFGSWVQKSEGAGKKS